MISRVFDCPTLYSDIVDSHQSFYAGCAPHAHGKQFAPKNIWRIVAVKIRLKRMGKIRAPYYRIVVVDSRTKRDGRSIEEIGKYHPTEEPSFIEVDSARAQYWLGVGAQPSEQVAAILKLTGDWGIFKGDKDAVSTVRAKVSKTDFIADEKKKPVLKPKAESPAPKIAAVEAPSKTTPEEAVPTDVVAADVVPSAASAAEAPTDEAAVDSASASGVAADSAAVDGAVEVVVAEDAPATEPEVSAESNDKA